MVTSKAIDPMGNTLVLPNLMSGVFDSRSLSLLILICWKAG